MLLLAPWILPWATLTAPQDAPLISLWIEDASACLSDPKDAALVQALRLIDDRVLELPGELPGFPALPPEAVQLAAHLLTGRKSLRLYASDDPNLMLPVFAQLEMQEGDAESAARLAETIVGLGRAAGLPFGEPGPDGLLPIQVPGGVPVQLGARGETVLLSVGKTIEEPGAPHAHGLPDGVRPSMTAHIDVGRMIELGLGMASMAAPDEAKQFSRVVEAFGLHGLVVEAALGSDDERSYGVTRAPGYAATLGEIGLLPARGLTSADLGLVPADAVWASVGTVEAQGTLEMVLALLQEQLAEAGIEDPIETIAAMTGFHVQADLVDHLGSVYGVYTSDTTGGGGLLSLVAFMELIDGEGMLETLERAQDLVDGIGAAEAEGYVRTRSWEHGGATLISLVFPGLPVPMEPTLAVTDHHLVLALTPQAIVAALDHARAGGRGLLGNERFTDGLAASPEGAYTVSFVDLPRLMRDGYGATSLLCSAIVNGTRSRTDAARDAGLVMPGVHALAAGARAQVSITRRIGDDFVTETRGDRSLLVNIAGSVGMVSSSPAMLLIPAMLLGVVAAREEARVAEWETIEAIEYEEEDDDQ